MRTGRSQEGFSLAAGGGSTALPDIRGPSGGAAPPGGGIPENKIVVKGVVAAIVGVVVATQTLKETQEAASATLVLKLRDTLEDDRYGKITDEIQDNDSAHALLRSHGGKFRDMDVEEYIGNFEDIGYLVRENVIVPEMAYDHFSYDVEKAWCNTDVQRTVREAQKADKSITAAADPMYGNFERLALSYLAKERQSCKDLNNQ